MARALLLSPVKFAKPQPKAQSTHHFTEHRSDCHPPRPKPPQLEFSGNLIQNRTRTKTEIVRKEKRKPSNHLIERLNIKKEDSKEYIVPAPMSASASDRVTSSVGSELQDDFENG